MHRIILFWSLLGLAKSITNDYIIVGGGTSGLVLANRLTEDPNVNVIVLEAGSHASQTSVGGTMYAMPNMNVNGNTFSAAPSLTIYDVPSYWTTAYWNIPGYSWTIPDVHLAKVLGGCSTCNAMFFQRGAKQDFERWNVEGWGWDDMLHYYKKVETNVAHPNSPLHGTSGPITVSNAAYVDELSLRFLNACIAAGNAANPDFNGESREGCGFAQVNIKNGIRDSAASAYLAPILNRSNLKIMLGATVTKVLFRNGKPPRAVGVEYKQDGKLKTIRAKREVILTGGAINTPKLLLLSGIGSKSQLESHGIKVVSDLPGVGRNLGNHAIAIMIFDNPNAQYNTLVSSVMQYAMNKSGPIGSPGYSILAFLKTKSGALPDVIIVYGPGDLMGAYSMRGDVVTAAVFCTESEPNGTVTLQSSDADANPGTTCTY
jgi:choline dehydrogenase-like flavoprotein